LTVFSGASGSVTGDKQFTVPCPDPTTQFAFSGQFDIQGSVTASYASNLTGVHQVNPYANNAWTIKQSSGNDFSGLAIVLCTLKPAP
jgi:hypothetical protein